MKKVKSSNNLMSFGGNTYNKVVELRNVFSPTRKMVSPNKIRPTPLGIWTLQNEKKKFTFINIFQ